MFDAEGKVIPVTLIEAGPCYITQIKTKGPRSIVSGELRSKQPRTSASSKRGTDGYEAIQIGFEALKERKIKKTQKQKPFRYLREFRGDIDISKCKVGDKIEASIFQEGDLVKASGISKGKGFAGVVKKWHFRGQCKTHGTKHEERTPGSVGTRFPQHVLKGRKMAGRMGSERTTVSNLKIVKVDAENNILAVRGAIPGRRGAVVEIKTLK